MRRDLWLVACAATAFLYFAAAVGVISYQPEYWAPGFTANSTDLLASRCEGAGPRLQPSYRQEAVNQNCPMTIQEQQACFQALMRGAIY